MAQGMVAVKDYFGYKSMAEFRKDWSELTDQDKTDLRTGVDNGTLTY